MILPSTPHCQPAHLVFHRRRELHAACPTYPLLNKYSENVAPCLCLPVLVFRLHWTRPGKPDRMFLLQWVGHWQWVALPEGSQHHMPSLTVQLNSTKLSLLALINVTASSDKTVHIAEGLSSCCQKVADWSCNTWTEGMDWRPEPIDYADWTRSISLMSSLAAFPLSLGMPKT